MRGTTPDEKTSFLIAASPVNWELRVKISKFIGEINHPFDGLKA
jgi:hypothetical protein